MANVFINEFHYDNAGGDVGEFVEIAGPADADLDGFSIVLYNGSNGSSYATYALTVGTSTVSNGVRFITVELPKDGLQNGAPDGIALVGPEGVVQFLSYEGAFTATDGPAAGMTSTDIGVAEGGEPAGQSLQLTGTGSEASDFTWTGPADETPGAANAGQTFTADGGVGGNDYGAPIASNDDFLKSLGFIDGLNGAEITAFDKGSKTLWVTSGDGLQVLDLSNPAAPSVLGSIDPVDAGATDSAVTSVTIKNGLVAAAVPGADEQSNGSVQFYDAATMAFLGAVTVGALPDMVTFTPDGASVLVANEGEPGDSNPEGSVSIIRGLDTVLSSGSLDGVSVATADFTGFNEDAEALRDAGVRLFPDVFEDGGITVAQDLEPEYIAVSPDGTTAFVTLQENNAVAVIDIATATVTAIQPMGVKDHSLRGNELDANDEDGAIDLQNAPVFGLYMPDAIASYAVNGTTYYITANEGDARSEDARVEDANVDSSVDTTGIERLDISTIDGDTDGDGDIDVLYSYGGRSFSIYDAAGNQVFDSGSTIARIIATETPELFNANDTDPEEFDGRSDNKGSEPEGVTVATVDGQTFAFVGLERVGTVMVFDITDPANVTYVDSMPANDPTGNVINAAPEGLTFISAEDSPNGAALLAVSYEDSDTVRILQVGADPIGEFTRISTIQGTGDTSPLEEQTVTIEAIVVGDFQDGDADVGRDLRGFYVQEEDGDADGDANTSEGIFIYEGTGDFLKDVAIGDKVRITGIVSEYFGETQLNVSNGGTVEIVSLGNALPSAAVIQLPTAETTLNQDGDTQPDLEAYEGMRVTFEDTLTITEQFQLDRFNEIKLFDTNGFEQTGPGGTTIEGERPFQYTQYNDPDAAGNAEYLERVGSRTITYDDGLNFQNQPISNLQGFEDYDTGNAPRMGDTITGLSGILDYKSAGNAASGATWRVRATETDTNSFDDANPRPAEMLSPSGNLKVASFNVLNFFTTLDQFPDSGADDVGPDQSFEPRGADTNPSGAVSGFGPTDEYDRQLSKLVEAISGLDADIVSLLEIENDFLLGGQSPGEQSAQGDRGIAIAALVDALNEAGDDTYAYVDPGSEFVGGDAIAVAMIYRADKVKIADGTSPAILTDADVDASILARSTVDNNGAAEGGSVFDGPSTNRSPLAVTFEELDEDGGLMTVVANHFKSKGGSGDGADADNGDGAGNFNNMRLLAAEALDSWLKTNPTGSDTGNIMLMGDFNAYASEDPIDYLTETAGFVDVAAALLETAYSFVFDGLIGTLDYAFASMDLFNQIVEAIEWHINADEADALDYNLEFGRDPEIFDGTNPYRSSDHDPIVVGFDLSGDDGDNAGGDTGGGDGVTGGGSDPVIDTGTDGGDVFENPTFPGSIDGGAGIDRVSLPNAYSDYVLTPTEGGFALALANDPSEVIDLSNVEVLQFGDLTLERNDSPEAATIYGLYGSIFGRTPDLTGISFWVDANESGVSLETVAEFFTQSAEFIDTSGANPTDDALVDGFFGNILGRTADAEGEAFWKAALDNGLSTADLLLGFAQSSEFVGLIDNQIDDGIFVIQ
ncbi:MAG: choice-of-anchor I family protein [Pseudomonadota bacterium]|nr:choice-of-anchor I family protein [Pseudomonadota bacterium]